MTCGWFLASPGSAEIMADCLPSQNTTKPPGNPPPGHTEQKRRLIGNGALHRPSRQRVIDNRAGEISLVYADDSLVCDVTGHMRLLSDPIDIVGLPSLLADAVITGSECVYVQITNSNELNQEVSR